VNFAPDPSTQTRAKVSGGPASCNASDVHTDAKEQIGGWVFVLFGVAMLAGGVWEASADKFNVLMALVFVGGAAMFGWDGMSMLYPRVCIGPTGIRFRVLPWERGPMEWNAVSDVEVVEWETSLGGGVPLKKAYLIATDGTRVRVVRASLVHTWQNPGPEFLVHEVRQQASKGFHK